MKKVKEQVENKKQENFRLSYVYRVYLNTEICKFPLEQRQGLHNKIMEELSAKYSKKPFCGGDIFEKLLEAIKAVKEQVKNHA